MPLFTSTTNLLLPPTIPSTFLLASTNLKLPKTASFHGKKPSLSNLKPSTKPIFSFLVPFPISNQSLSLAPSIQPSIPTILKLFMPLPPLPLPKTTVFTLSNLPVCPYPLSVAIPASWLPTLPLSIGLSLTSLFHQTLAKF